MFVSGQSRLANMVFSALTFTVGIPSAIKVFNWVATLYKGDIRLKTPMLYALSFLLLFTIGGLTGLFLGILVGRRPPPRHVLRRRPLPLRDDGLDAGRVPRRRSTTGGRSSPAACTTSSSAAIVRARRVLRVQPDVPPAVRHGLARHAAPLLGLRPAVPDLPPALDDRRLRPRHLDLHHGRLADLRRSRTARSAPRNPWGASSLEWQAPTPPPLYNFEKPPVLHELYNYDDLVEVEPDVWERMTPIEDRRHAPTSSPVARSRRRSHDGRDRGRPRARGRPRQGRGSEPSAARRARAAARRSADRRAGEGRARRQGSPSPRSTKPSARSPTTKTDKSDDKDKK